jgi:pimeloyl-ACP methyl ester carboxylesterase
MPEDGTFAIGNDEQYRPVLAVGDQRVRAGAGLLACHASRPLAGLRRGEPLVVVVHGALRDSDRYLADAQDAARRAGSDALIVAPQFLSVADLVPEGTLYWDVEGWKGGYPALGAAAVSSFTAMDSLLDQFATAEVVIFGNSAGGQFVNRYAAVGRGPDLLARRGVRVRFIISNPSTYLYFGRDRPYPVPDGARVNRWRYGFDDAPAYVHTGPRQSLERYLGRDVTIVLGAQDTDRAARLLEVSPAAMAQGTNRFDRGIRYDQHVRRHAREAGLTAGHNLIQLAGAGHAASDVLDQIGEMMFGHGGKSEPAGTSGHGVSGHGGASRHNGVSGHGGASGSAGMHG